jgi:hypothetical protein
MKLASGRGFKERFRKKPPRTVYVGSHEDKLSRVRPTSVDADDDRPTREDRQGHGSPFDIPVPVPRILQPRPSEEAGLTRARDGPRPDGTHFPMAVLGHHGLRRRSGLEGRLRGLPPRSAP